MSENFIERFSDWLINTEKGRTFLRCSKIVFLILDVIFALFLVGIFAVAIYSKTYHVAVAAIVFAVIYYAAYKFIRR